MWEGRQCWLAAGGTQRPVARKPWGTPSRQWGSNGALAEALGGGEATGVTSLSRGRGAQSSRL